MPGFRTEFSHTLRRLRGQIIGWGIGLALYGLLMGLLFDSIQTIFGLEEMLASYPPALMAFFGDVTTMNTPAGYFGVYYSSYMPLIIGIFICSAAAGLLAGDEERGTLDLVLAHPVGRTAIFWGRWAGLSVATGAILLLAWLGWAVTLPFTNFDISAVNLLLGYVPMWALLALFGALALLFSMLLPSARLAAMSAGALLVGNWLLSGLAALNENVRAVLDLTPWALFQGGEAIIDLAWGPALALIAIAVALAAAAWWLFLRRDIRVGGERSWSLRRAS
ncbi:MAG: ABC transporter permease subunit [Candidatus Promineofilum sp.]|nr:ABC transporter permease subunit [Promineifilum sp.]